MTDAITTGCEATACVSLILFALICLAAMKAIDELTKIK